jgi:hypothetical protein
MTLTGNFQAGRVYELERRKTAGVIISSSIKDITDGKLGKELVKQLDTTPKEN